MRGLVVALLLSLTFLAGCGDAAPKAPAEIIVESTIPTNEITSNDTAEYKPSEKTMGHLAGVVVDQAIRPLEGASVHLPGMDLTETTDRDGHFGFVDLQPGPYYVTISLEGYYSAEAVLEVNEDKFTRAKVILEAIPPPEPRHLTQQFDGFANVGGDPVFGLSSCTCTFNFYLEPTGLQAVIVEATMSEYSNGAGGSNNFYHQFRDYSYPSRTHSSGDQGNPMRAETHGDFANSDYRYSLTVRPEAFPVPETNKKFTTYVTSWYNELPPVGWTFLNGDV